MQEKARKAKTPEELERIIREINDLLSDSERRESAKKPKQSPGSKKRPE